MKQIITLLVLNCCIGFAFSQSTLSICAFVESNGNCILSNNKFISQPDSIHQNLFLHVKDVKNFAGTSKITYKIYSINKQGAEKYESMIEQNVQPTWMYAWLPHVFASPGKFSVKVFNDANQLMCSKTVELLTGK